MQKLEDVKNNSLIVALIIFLIIVGVFGFFFSQNSNQLIQQKPLVEIVKLCEFENPRFNANQECQNIIDSKYSNKNCTFNFSLPEYLPLGSCRNCTIICE